MPPLPYTIQSQKPAADITEKLVLFHYYYLKLKLVVPIQSFYNKVYCHKMKFMIYY